MNETNPGNPNPGTPTSGEATSRDASIRRDVRRLMERPSASVLIIGGGINGIATFRELALNGVDVVLVERSDFASGASAASSHMIHGGIRYLENGELRLVRESVQERNALLRLAPHRVHPLQTVIPMFSTFSGILSAPLRLLRHGGGRPKERGALLIKVGLLLYDVFSRDRGRVPRHRFNRRRRSRREFPRLNRDVKFTAVYYDASVPDPERFALDVLLDGLDAGDHARAANYVTAIGADADGVRLRDEETGAEFVFTPELVVNASGPWTDLTNDALGAETEFMGGTKGSHIVLDHPELFDALGGREFFFENDDGRIVLIYPLKGRVLVGTTDLEADPAEPAVCTEGEVDYFFGLVAHVFPDIRLERPQIVFRFAGIRPLPQHGDLKPGFVSRDYRLVDTPIAGGALPAISLVGGKWTTFRALGVRLADEAMARIGVPRTVDLSATPFGGGAGFPSAAERRAWLSEKLGTWPRDRAEALLARYGTRAQAVAAAEIVFGDRLDVGGMLSPGELRYLVDRERAVRGADLLVRRTDAAFTGSVTVRLIRELASALGSLQGWDADRVGRDVAETIAVLRERHGWMPDAG
jgi:glycerol-3-phosphate dehydrogenase